MSSACHFLIKKGHIFSSFSNKLKTYVIVKKNVLIIHCRARRYNFATRIPSIAVSIWTWYILKHFYPCCRRLNETARVFAHKLFICSDFNCNESKYLHSRAQNGVLAQELSHFPYIRLYTNSENFHILSRRTVGQNATKESAPKVIFPTFEF